jgi:hypothetical protein
MVTKIKKAIIYFDDGSGSGYGSGKRNISRKIGEVLDIKDFFVHFLENNGTYHLISVFRVVRIINDENVRLLGETYGKL